MTLTDAQIRRVGTGIALLVPTWGRWIHRTVHCVAFVDTLETRHAITKYFTVPDRDVLPAPAADSDYCYLPIARLRKELFINFDAIEASGQRVAVVTAVRARRMCLAALDSLAEAEVGRSLPPRVKRDVDQILGRDGKQSRAELERFTDAADDRNLRRDLSSEDCVFWRLANLLAEDRLIIFELSATPGQTRIVTFSFDLPAQTLMPLDLVSDRRNRVSRAVAFKAKNMILPLPDVGDAGSYHFEAEAPQGLQFQQSKLELYSPPDETKLVDLDARPTSSRRALFDISPQVEGTMGLSSISVRPTPGTVVGGGTLLGVITTCLVAWTAVRAPHIAGSSAATLLLIVPGLLAVLVARPGEHPLTSKALVGLRTAALVPGLASIFGAAVLIGKLDTSLTQWLLGCLAVVSACATIFMAVAWWRCRVRARPIVGAARDAREDIRIA
jgi:hypothetical protein